MADLTDDERTALRAAGLDIDAEDEPITLAVFATAERIIADRERAARAEALRDAADDLARFADETYPADIFRRPTSEQYAEINALLKRERGHQLDGIAADCYHHAITVQASRLREWASDADEETRP